MIKLLVALAAVAAIGFYIYLNAGLPDPREQDRVGPLTGEFSIIKPRDWDSSVAYAVPPFPYPVYIEIMPAKRVGKGLKLFAGRMRNAPDVAKFKANGMYDATFQGQPALVFSGIGKQEFVWQAIFQRGSAWYEIALHVNTIIDDVPHSDWWPYIESFKCNPLPPTTAESIK
ncbi:MAG TPA: hypothetical protein VHD56_06910 [Tepidisphaeraceae bacterium]|nr:hypothetical protein [Tepidisphaeraceae bacterium]